MGLKEAASSLWASGNLELIYRNDDLNTDEYSYSQNVELV